MSALEHRALHRLVLRGLQRARRVASQYEASLAKALENAQRSREELERWTRLLEEAAPLVYEDATTETLRFVAAKNSEWDAADVRRRAA